MADREWWRHGQFAGLASLLWEMWWYKTGEELDPEMDRVLIGWIKQYGQPILVDAILQVVAASVRKHSVPDIEDVPRYAKVVQADDREPGMGDCYLARGQMRIKYRLVEEEDSKLLQLLADAMRKGVPTDEFFEAIEENETLRDCLAALGIDPKEYEGLGRQKIPLVVQRSDFDSLAATG